MVYLQCTISNSTACYVSSMLPSSPGSIQFRLEKFTRVQVAPSLKHTHTFDCPDFALQSTLAAGKFIPNKDARARLDVYLRPILRHAWSVALVLNLSTGLVSPQYHVIFEDFFKTTQFNRADRQLPSAWQRLADFDHEDCCRKATTMTETVRQQLWVVTPVKF